MYDVAVIGGGCAGASAAVFFGYAGVKTLVLDNDKGMTRRAWIPNHYGFPDGVSGPDLVEAGRKQATKNGAQWVIAQVSNVEEKNGGFVITTEDGQTYEAKQVVLATGGNTSLAEKLGLEITEGQEPHFPKVVKVDAKGHTNRPGIWVTGVLAGISAHTIITAGHGAAVAVELLSELQGKRHVQHEVLKK